MITDQISKAKAQYSMNNDGCFVIENYNFSTPFSNFFPGIAGLYGIPMWVFYVNRGQCIASFGIESKDKAIMEFQPANKSYRYTSLNGFRTFIKVKTKNGIKYWEPFQSCLLGTEYKKQQTMSITAHDLTISEVNEDLGLTINVNYFTVCDEPFASLIRNVEIINNNSNDIEVELIDGLPLINAYGLNDWLTKHLARTVEAWVKVRNLDKDAAYYQLNVEIADVSEVKHIKQGNFFFSFDSSSNKLFRPIVESSCVFGEATDFTAPRKFLEENFELPSQFKTDSKTPCAMNHAKFNISKGNGKKFTSVYGFAKTQYQLNNIVSKVIAKDFIDNKAQANKNLVTSIRSYAFTNSSSDVFNQYSGYTFLDNILRGGLPVSVKSSTGNVAFNVYSRKHGDLERDYNFFFVAPTYYSQGNGNYRDVNQNRRNDCLFNTDVGASHLINFLNLSQADGYNPLIVKGTTFYVDDKSALEKVLIDSVIDFENCGIKEFLSKSFMAGDLLIFVDEKNVKLKVDKKEFFGRILEICKKQELADHGEGFWSDHWHYNLDLIESYLSIFPEGLSELLLNKKEFYFYHNCNYVKPRIERYVLTDKGVRQYHSVCEAEHEVDVKATHNKLRVKNGEGAVYQTTLVVKLLCLIANKIATLDPSGVGVEMESDKPNWYDALNGLPGLLGSSISETLEIKRFAIFLNESIKQLKIEDTHKIGIFEELATFISGLTNVLLTENNPLNYWNKSNDIKEHYRKRIIHGIEGTEKQLTVKEIKHFLELVIGKINKSVEVAKNSQGFLPTYFYHEVTEYQQIDKSGSDKKVSIKPTVFKRHDLPLFLEGYVHALRSETKIENAKRLYSDVCQSDLYDKKLKMYKVNASLKGQSEEIGRTSVFPAGWLENESIWLHMEYKFLLELLRKGLYKDYYENFNQILVPFLKPEVYGRSILENSSFIVSSAHEDVSLHGRGFVARLSGSTAEFLHIWLYMCIGQKPFTLMPDGKLNLIFDPILEAGLFTNCDQRINYITFDGRSNEIDLPKNTFAFNLFGRTLVVYHNDERKNTFGDDKCNVKEVKITYLGKTKPVEIESSIIPEPFSKDIRNNLVERIDVWFE